MAEVSSNPKEILEVDFDSDGDSSSMKNGDDANIPMNIQDSMNVFDKTVDAINVLDVYNIASSVGQEFERLTDAFGGAVFSGVMPKIIRILEMLESLVAKNEEEAVEITELNSSLQKLQIESQLKDKKQQQEIEVIESAWKDETRSLLVSVKTLEDDNQKLTAILSEKLEEESENEVCIPEQQTLIAKLQEQLNKQRNEIRAKNAHIEVQSREAEALQSQIQRLTNLNVNIRNKISMLEQQGKSLIEQKADLEAKLHGRNHAMAEMQLRSIQEQRKHDAQSTNEPGDNVTETDAPVVDPLLANKLVIDLSDPNRPRYTLQELQEVLNDRNQLKARCFLLEEELIFYKGLAKKYGFEETWVELNEGEIKESKKHVQDLQDTPQESGIRRFFQYLTGDSSWRRSTQQKPNPRPRQHHVVEVGIERELIKPSEIEKLLPENLPADADESINVQPQPVFSEMKVMSSEEEREDLSP